MYNKVKYIKLVDLAEKGRVRFYRKRLCSISLLRKNMFLEQHENLNCMKTYMYMSCIYIISFS